MNTPAQDTNPAERFQTISEDIQCDAQGCLPLESGFNPQQQLLPPYVCILNHEVFPDQRRLGSSQDVRALCKTFSSLQCQIEVVCNPTLAMVNDTIRKLVLKRFDRLSGLVIVMLSYGLEQERIRTCDDEGYDLDVDVLFPLLENETLSGKPKILITQAGQGNGRPPFSKKIPSPYIKCFSSSGGFMSYRRVEEGSIFIQALCEVMDQDGLTKDFRLIIYDVNARVEEIAESLGLMQVPSILSTLRKPFCFGDFVQYANARIPRTSPSATIQKTSTIPGISITDLQPPLVYIFNHEIFKNTVKNRSGSSKDVDALRSTFENLNCEVHEVPNPTLAMIQGTFKKLEVENLKLRSAVVIAILSHGNRNELIEACDDTNYYLDDDVLFPLLRNDTLRGKPKILIVQACKGILEADSNRISCNPRDFIICYGTTEGFEAYRHPFFGSPFIQTLCQHMDKDGKTKDFQKIMQAVNQSVTEEAPDKYKKEMIPSYTSTFGTKKFYFWHNIYIDQDGN
uniref:Uncharacterized protein LOC108049260 n=1 Tax=Drosophila rhopaloa TaxID=1041015 RepID=A0A6P4F9W2_DRORH